MDGFLLIGNNKSHMRVITHSLGKLSLGEFTEMDYVTVLQVPFI